MALPIDPETNEPYLSLPAPLSAFRITPIRESEDDIDRRTAILTDKLVYPHLHGPPHPYRREHAVEFTADILKEYEQGRAPCPVRVIRDPSGAFIGDIGITRNMFSEVKDVDERKRLTAENAAKMAGDPTIVWTFGDMLSSAYHGRGIMSAAIRTIMNDYAIPHLNVRHVIVWAYADNVGSHRVFEKYGFAKIGESVHHVDMTAKGRTDLRLFVFEWKAEGSSSTDETAVVEK